MEEEEEEEEEENNKLAVAARRRGQTLSLLLQCARALLVLHDGAVYHGDVKSLNFLFRRCSPGAVGGDGGVGGTGACEPEEPAAAAAAPKGG